MSKKQTNSNADSNTLRVGDIFVQAGVVTPEVIEERLEVSKLLGQQLGQTLEQTGDVTRYQLVCAVQLQSLYLDGAINIDALIHAMRLVSFEEYFFEDALSAVGCVDETVWSTRLGELLSESGLVSEQQLSEALDISFREGAPLGQVLMRDGGLEPAVIARALAMQRQIRSGQITRDQAIRDLRQQGSPAPVPPAE